ncbi:MAG TPA: NAD(P)H-dependent oxidoreductase [Longimicrobiaceae bacterium]|nr:NAD(P)H-dependent oxidoreductase [Longimicrobiaceae bacterium]
MSDFPEIVPPVRVLGLCGSRRAGSYNRSLLRTAAGLAPAGMEVVEHDLGALPFFDPDLPPTAPRPRAVAAFIAAVEAADALLIATPEYNYCAPAMLTNALDWASQPPASSPLKGKVAALMGASTGIGGTIRAQMQLRNSFVYTQVSAVLQPEVLVAAAHTKFTPEGELVDEVARRFIARLMRALADQVLRHRTAETPILV